MANFPNKKPEKSLFQQDQDMIDGIGAKAAMDAETSKQAKAKKDAKTNTVDYSEATKPKKTTSEKKPAKKGLFGEGDAKTRNGKANVSKKQLDAFGGTGTPAQRLTQYMKQWNKSGKRPTKASKDASGSGSGTKADAPAKKTFRQRRAANLKAKIADENVGEGRKRRLKRRLGRVERRMARNAAGGGMMKSKMSSKGGKMGGKMAPGYNEGGSAKKPVPKDNKGLSKLPKDVRNKMGYMNEGGEAKVKKPNRRSVLKSLMTIGKRKAQELHGKAAVNQAVKDLNQISGVTPTKKVKTEKEKKLAAADSRASMSKFSKKTPAAKKQDQIRTTEKRLERGFKNGGMAKKGYSKGGAVKKKSKPRGVGVALRGYGKAMR